MNHQGFWDQRAKLGAEAGTNDVIAKELEMRAIARYVKDGMRILDAGCGNGQTLARLAPSCLSVTGIDASLPMIQEAMDAVSEGVFYEADIRRAGVWEQGPPYDLVYTERCLINLISWREQRDAAIRLMRLVKPGGRFLMCENSEEGLAQVNGWRSNLGLPMILPPWHNRYLRDEEVAELDAPPFVLQRVEYPGSVYALLSRIVNAKLAAEAGREPDYDSPINRCALSIPTFGQFGQTRLWVFRRMSLGERILRAFWP